MIDVKFHLCNTDQGLSTRTDVATITSTWEYQVYALNGRPEFDDAKEDIDGNLYPSGKYRDVMSVEGRFMTIAEADTFYQRIKSLARGWAYIEVDWTLYKKIDFRNSLTGIGTHDMHGVIISNLDFTSGKIQRVSFDLTLRGKRG